MVSPGRSGRRFIAYTISNSLLLVCLGLTCLAPQCLAITSEEIKSVFKDADSAEIQGEPYKAIKLYTGLISSLEKSDKDNPKLARAQARVARLLLLDNQYDQATPYYDKLLNTFHNRAKEDPELMVDLDDLSNVYLKFNSNPAKQNDSLMRSLKIRQFINVNHPHLPENYRMLASMCFAKNQTKPAREWMEKAIAIDKTYPRQKMDRLVQDLNMLGGIYLRAKDYKSATMTFNDALRIAKINGCSDMQTGQCYLNLGQTNFEQNQYDQADANYQLAMAKLKNCPPSYNYVLQILNDKIKQNNGMRAASAKKAHRGK